MAHVESGDDARFCDVCLMWLNGVVQLNDHLGGRKHAKNVRRLAMIPVYEHADSGVQSASGLPPQAHDEGRDMTRHPQG